MEIPFLNTRSIKWGFLIPVIVFILLGHAGELVLQTYGNFLEEYSSQLQAIQEVVSVNNELKFYPVQIQVSNRTFMDMCK